MKILDGAPRIKMSNSSDGRNVSIFGGQKATYHIVVRSCLAETLFGLRLLIADVTSQNLKLGKRQSHLI